MKLATTLGSIGVCALLASCAIGPDYRPPEPATALQWQAALPHGGNPAALIDWWKQFDDPLVAELITIAGRDSPTLDAALARHQADGQLQQQLVNKREELAAKQALIRQLGSLSLQKSQGYAGVMADLARLRDARLSLQRIEINDGRINLSGVAERSQDVPAWVNRFKQTPSLAGKQFGELTLSRDKAGQLAFQLSGIARETP